MADKNVIIKQRKAASKPSPIKTAPKPENPVRTKEKNSKMEYIKNARPEKKNGYIEKLKKLTKIDKLPKTVAESIPIAGVLQNGIIETKKGNFTKCYELTDIDYRLASEEDKEKIRTNFASFMNSFAPDVRWEFTVFSHSVNKKESLSKIKLPLRNDGLNKYRQEYNHIFLDSLREGNNSLKKSIYLTVSIEDFNPDRASSRLKTMDSEIRKRLDDVGKVDVKVLSIEERMSLLFDIYNQDDDYRLATGLYDDGSTFKMKDIKKQGRRFIDMIGPSSMTFNVNHFMLGEKYGQTLCLSFYPNKVSYEFLGELELIDQSSLISVTVETMPHVDAVKMAKRKKDEIHAKEAEVQMKNTQDGYFGSVSSELTSAKEAGEEWLNELTDNDQNSFFVTFTITVFADSLEELKEKVDYVKNIGNNYLCQLRVLSFQQEFAFNTCLPLARNDLTEETMLLSDNMKAFIPFNSRELQEDKAVYYGKNRTTDSMIVFSRMSGTNYNSLIFGTTGSGKSFTAKNEMIQMFLRNENMQIFVIDPQGEYSSVAKALGGTVVDIKQGSRSFLNPLDLDIIETADGDTDPITMKCDSLLSIMEIIMGQKRELGAIYRTIIDRILRRLYKPYIRELQAEGKTYDKTIAPTLVDLYNELRADDEEPEAQILADTLELYTMGSFNTFAHRSNIETDSRFVSYNIKQIGSGMRNLGLHICLSDIWNKVLENAKKHIWSMVYIDEFHLLLKSPSSVKSIVAQWKTIRKFQGGLCGITQNTEDMINSEDTRNIINNSDMTIMMHVPTIDLNNLQILYKLSEDQVSLLDKSKTGQGVIYNSRIVLPFALDFPKDTELYKIITTKNEEKV